MPEAKPSDEQATESLREQLGQDGHLTENVVSLIAHQVAAVRDMFGNPMDTNFELVDAFAGKRNKVPQQTADRLITLRQVLRNNPITGDALNAAIYSSTDQRKQLAEAYPKGFPALRSVALAMTIPVKPGERRISLGEKIKSQTPRR